MIGGTFFYSLALMVSLIAPEGGFAMGKQPQRIPPRIALRQVPPPNRPHPTKPTPVAPSPKIPEPPKQLPPRGIVGEVYRHRYALPTADTKLIDNHGDGYGRLYGLRNVRAVLNGVFYRGGANNYYSKIHHRSNMNPLPEEGLENLCSEGFGQAVYLYGTNFRSASHLVRCRSFDGHENALEYFQISPLESNSALERIHDLIFDHIRNPRLGPIYTHCWNGWHASGFVAATALKQFCGFTDEQAVRYWNENTDGHAGRSYNGIRARIRAFQPRAGLTLSEQEKTVLCPRFPAMSYLP